MTDQSETYLYQGLTVQNYNYLKCWFALSFYGKEVFQIIFTWGFNRSPTELKEALFEIHNYSNKKYRSDFDLVQREKIENGLINEFDVTLFYLLLQRVCGLPGPADKMWSKDGDPDSLPTFLYQIKMLRNALAHEKVDISEENLEEKFSTLKFLLSTALVKAGMQFNITDEEVTSTLERLSTQIYCLQTSSSVPVDQLRSIAKQKLDVAIEEARTELLYHYESLSKVVFAPWTVAESLQNINDIFTEPLLKYDKNDILFKQMDIKESFVDTADVLVTTLADDTLPNFILFLSSSGMGKTMLSKYIIQAWCERNQKVKGIDEVDLVLYIDYRISRCSSFEEILTQLMPGTVHLLGKFELKLLIKAMKVLIILDNIDDIRNEAVPSYEEILQMNTRHFRILATSTQNIARSLSRTYQQKYLKLNVEGFSANSVNSCVSKIYSAIHEWEKVNEEDVKLFCSEYLKTTNRSTTEHIRSPEVLSHIFFHWLTQGKKEASYTTKTQIFLTTHELLRIKLLEKMEKNVQTKLLEHKLAYDNLNKLFKKLFNIAFDMFVMGACELSASQFDDIIGECQTLGLPFLLILKAIFCFKESEIQNSLSKSTSVEFPSFSSEVFYAAMHVTDILILGNWNSLVGFHENFAKNKNFILLLKFIVGILASSNIVALEKHISNILTWVDKQCLGHSFRIWIEIVEESRCQRSVMDKVTKYLGSRWALEDHEICAASLTLLKNYPPQELSLTLCVNPDEIACLPKILDICFQTRGLSLCLNFYYNFWVDKNQSCDKYLSNFLTRRSLLANVESFAGKLMTCSLLRLPPTLKRLALHIRPEDITILNESLKSLTNLVMLYLNFDISVNFPAKRVPTLRLPRTDILLYVDLWNIAEHLIAWSCDILSSFSPAYCRVTLRKTRLQYESSKTWLEEIRQRRIHIDSVTIGSAFPVTPDQLECLRSLAGSFECLDFQWLLL